MLTFYEFFAGGGMARLGLGQQWRCLFANDIDPKKAASYRANFNNPAELRVADVGQLRAADLPGHADLAWASFPCQDLSLAGAGGGLDGARSGAFWPFWRLLEGLARSGRKPPLIVLENVCGALTANGGRDFGAIGSAFAAAGYRFGAIVVDAIHFVPQSRPRLFIVGVARDVAIPPSFTTDRPLEALHSPSLVAAHARLSKRAKAEWIWWRLALPARRAAVFADLVEADPIDVSWASAGETRKLLSQMSPTNLAKVRAAKKTKRRMVGGIYRRTRIDSDGAKIQRAEIRFDDIAGCLRTPSGGSSRQRILVAEGNRIRTRLLSAREAARLMGLPDSYVLPARYNDAYHLVGDGVVVPVVRWLRSSLLSPLANAARKNAVLMAAE